MRTTIKNCYFHIALILNRISQIRFTHKADICEHGVRIAIKKQLKWK